MLQAAGLPADAQCAFRRTVPARPPIISYEIFTKSLDSSNRNQMPACANSVGATTDTNSLKKALYETADQTVYRCDQAQARD
jgi:hypothetical protein